MASKRLYKALISGLLASILMGILAFQILNYMTYESNQKAIAQLSNNLNADATIIQIDKQQLTTNTAAVTETSDNVKKLMTNVYGY